MYFFLWKMPYTFIVMAFSIGFDIPPSAQLGQFEHHIQWWNFVTDTFPFLSILTDLILTDLILLFIFFKHPSTPFQIIFFSAEKFLILWSNFTKNLLCDEGWLPLHSVLKWKLPQYTFPIYDLHRRHPWHLYHCVVAATLILGIINIIV